MALCHHLVVAPSWRAYLCTLEGTCPCAHSGVSVRKASFHVFCGHEGFCKVHRASYILADLAEVGCRPDLDGQLAARGLKLACIACLAKCAIASQQLQILTDGQAGKHVCLQIKQKFSIQHPQLLGDSSEENKHQCLLAVGNDSDRILAPSLMKVAGKDNHFRPALFQQLCINKL